MFEFLSVLWEVGGRVNICFCHFLQVAKIYQLLFANKATSELDSGHTGSPPCGAAFVLNMRNVESTGDQTFFSWCLMEDPVRPRPEFVARWEPIMTIHKASAHWIQTCNWFRRVNLKTHSRWDFYKGAQVPLLFSWFLKFPCNVYICFFIFGNWLIASTLPLNICNFVDDTVAGSFGSFTVRFSAQIILPLEMHCIVSRCCVA